MSLLPTLVNGILLGLGAAAPIGPVNIEIARRSIRSGFAAGFFLGGGAVTIDAIYVILSTYSTRFYVNHPRIMLAITLAGIAFLAYLGIASLRHAFRQFRTPQTADAPLALKPAMPDSSEGSPLRHYLTGLLMTAFNPMTITFWFVQIPSQAAVAGLSRAQLIPLSLGVFLGTLSWVCFFAAICSRAGQKWKHRAILAADLLGGILLLAFSLYLAHWGLTPIIRRSIGDQVFIASTEAKPQPPIRQP